MLQGSALGGAGREVFGQRAERGVPVVRSCPVSWLQWWIHKPPKVGKLHRAKCTCMHDTGAHTPHMQTQARTHKYSPTGQVS